ESQPLIGGCWRLLLAVHIFRCVSSGSGAAAAAAAGYRQNRRFVIILRASLHLCRTSFRLRVPGHRLRNQLQIQDPTDRVFSRPVTRTVAPPASTHIPTTTASSSPQQLANKSSARSCPPSPVQGRHSLSFFSSKCAREMTW
ncbi:unnamed protein product, partial [Ectocarpus sp. 12 AP-2014]